MLCGYYITGETFGCCSFRNVCSHLLFFSAGRFLPALEKELNAMLGLKTWVLPAHDKQLDSFNVWLP